MKPIALVVVLSACVHASPLTALGSVATKAIAPSPAAQAAGVRAAARLASAPSIATAISAAPEVAMEAVSSVPVVVAAVASSPGPLGVLAGLWEGAKANPALTALILLALLNGAFALARAFHWISAKRAKQADGVVSGVLAVAEPIAAKTLTPFDDIGVEVLKKIHASLLEIAAEDEAVAVALSIAHEEHAVEAPKIS